MKKTLGIFACVLLVAIAINHAFKSDTQKKDHVESKIIEKSETLPLQINEKIAGKRKAVLETVSYVNDNNKESSRHFKEALSNIKLNPVNFKQSLLESGLDKSEIEEYLKRTFQQLFNCLPEGCGQLPDREDGFYDPAKTIAVSLSITILEIHFANFEESELPSWPKKEHYLELINHPNEKLRNLALLNFIKTQPEEYAEEILGIIETLSGDALNDVIQYISPKLNHQQKLDLIDRLITILKDKDPYKATIIAKNLKDLNPSKEVIKEISEELCFFHKNTRYAATFNSLKYHMGSASEEFSEHIDLKEFCKIRL